MKSHSAYELGEHYLFSPESFCNLLLKVLDLGTLATKVFLAMFRHRRGWTTTELARAVEDHRSNVYVALRRLQEAGYVERVSRTEWRLSKPASV